MKLQQIIKQEVLGYLKEIKILKESGFARLANILRGDIPYIKTLAIFTAANPKTSKTDAAMNNELNKELMADLRQANYGPIMMAGMFDNFEHSFAIPNINKEDTISYGKKYNQTSVIWGYKTNEGMTFEYIVSDTGDVESVREVFIDASNRKNFYSIIHGRKFTIPFFDPVYEDSKWNPEKHGQVIGTKPETVNESIRIVGSKKFTYNSEDLLKLKNPEIDKLVNKIKKQQEFLFENTNKSGKSMWESRGIIRMCLFKLQNLIK
ncbi:DUF3293 domain-containing protein [Candidatus Pacearchaeota archaeon]|jgi:hypothetical protein|nr:DUF3293 domain-containing protein [Candidatus Pacearchaeota archaeon]